MAFMEISVVPLGTGNTSLSAFVANVVREVEASGLEYRLHDMGTTIRGEAAELFALAARLHEVPFGQGVERVYTVIKIDDRRDRQTGMDEKTASVQAHLGRSSKGSDETGRE